MDKNILEHAVNAEFLIDIGMPETACAPAEIESFLKTELVPGNSVEGDPLEVNAPSFEDGRRIIRDPHADMLFR